MDLFDEGFDFFNIFFIVIAVLVVGLFIFVLINMIGHRKLFNGVLRRAADQMERDDHAPRLTVTATVVSKRSNITVHHHTSDSVYPHTSTTTSYYATFQVQSGDRMELSVPSTEYGLLVEGDEGDLTFQGSRFLRFDRRWGA